MEGRPFIHGPLGPNTSAMSGNDALHGREADAGPLEIFGAVQALERAKELLRVAHVEAHAVVSHEEGRHAVVRFATEADVRRLALTD